MKDPLGLIIQTTPHIVKEKKPPLQVIKKLRKSLQIRVTKKDCLGIINKDGNVEWY